MVPSHPSRGICKKTGTHTHMILYFHAACEALVIDVGFVKNDLTMTQHRAGKSSSRSHVQV